LDDTRTLPGGGEDGAPTDLLEEADRLSGEALRGARRAPALIPSLLGTRGGVLVEQGKYEEGAALLRDVLEELDVKELKAVCHCYLALAAARSGDAAGAEKHLAEARALFPESVFLEGAARQVSRPRPAAE